jgi:hypothetical protein
MMTRCMDSGRQLEVYGEFIQRACIFGITQSFAVVVTAEVARESGQQVEVLLMGLLGYQQQKQDVHPLVVRGIEIDGIGQGDQGAQRALAVTDATVWNGNAIAEGGAPQLLPRQEPGKDIPGFQMWLVCMDQCGGGFEQAFLADALCVALGSGQCQGATQIKWRSGHESVSAMLFLVFD